MSLRTASQYSILLAALCIVAGCSSTPPAKEYLDGETAATITIGAPSIVMARDRFDLAVHARDYITLTPVQVNRAGRRNLYLHCQIWSTIDRRADKAVIPSSAELALLADDRRFPLPNSAADLRALGFGASPIEPASSATEVRMLGIDIDALRFLTRTDRLRIALTQDKTTEYFELWRGSPRQWAPLLDQLGGGR